VENVTPLRIADVRGESSAQLLSLDGECEWFGCKVQHNSGPVITDAAKGILSGMSGTKADRSSPIRGADHAATTKGHDHAQTKRIAIGGEAYAVSL